MPNLAERLATVKDQISNECTRLGRSEPTLIVVTKNHSSELADQLYRLGERNFGENRVQEGVPKALELGKADINWHLIGQLQTNKVKQALEFANTVHSLDRQSLLTELTKRTIERENPLEVFIQVNLTSDDARGGVQPNQTLGLADAVAQVPTLKLMGLMAVASLENEPEADFESIAELSKRLRAIHPSAHGLSIGMSGDYLQALNYGATHLRIGTAITGNRQY
ncbi:MAG: YggS family pyridoxal phosphate-dependent enzyme [Micrococcales bacterium]